MNITDFALTVTEALEATAKVLRQQSLKLRDLERLISAFDTRLDRLEVPVQEHDPNAAAESRHGEPI